jgi:hypothetical protein
LVLKSTNQSIENKEVSLLAIFEIIASVTLYWYIAYKFDIYMHIVVSIMIAPLLLLRSEQSKKYALDSFAKLLNSPNRNTTIMSSTIINIMGIIIGTFLTSIIFPHFEVVIKNSFSLIVFGFILGVVYSALTLMLGIFFRYAVSPIGKYNLFFILYPTFGIGIYGIFFEKNNIESGFMSSGSIVAFGFVLLSLLSVKKTGTPPSLALAGGGLGLTFVAIWYKFSSIILNLKDGIGNFSENWKENNFIIDIVKTPEIMYDIENDDRFNEDIKLSHLFSHKYVNTSGILTGLIDISMYILYYAMYYFMALFYRISIKSTFWFYFPLLFLVQLPDNLITNNEEKGSFLSSLYETEIAKTAFFVSKLIVIVFVLQFFFKFDPLEAIDTIKGFLPKDLDFILKHVDCRILSLWCLLLVIISMLTVLMYWYANKIRVTKWGHGLAFKIEPIFYMYLTRRWIVYLLFLVGIIYIINDFKIYDYQYVPDFFKDLSLKLLNIIEGIKISILE